MAIKLKPIHPAEHPREDLMKPLGLTSNALAHALEVAPARINKILRERRGSIGDTARRLARFFDTDAQNWLNLRNHYDLQCAEDAARAAIKTHSSAPGYD